MHAGAAVISTDECLDPSERQTAVVYKKDGASETLTYGIDICEYNHSQLLLPLECSPRPSGQREQKRALVSCSFYENSIHIWHLNPPALANTSSSSSI